MKILIIVAGRLKVPFDEGASRSALEFIRSLNAEKILISLSEKDFELDGIKVIHSPLIKSRIIEYFIYALVTTYYAARIKADKVYYFPLCFPNTFLGILHQLHAYTLSKISKDFIEILYQTGEPKFLFKALSRFKIGVTSRGYAKQFEKYGLNVSYLPMVYPKRQKKYSKEKLRKEYGFKQGDFVALHVGHLQKDRGLDVLSKLSGLMSDIKIVVVLSSMKTTVKIDLERENIYIINRYIEDIYELYAVADVYIFPIKSKSSAIDIPLSILEAKEMNLPIIASDLNGIREALMGYPEAYFLEIASSEEMVKNIEGYIKQIRSAKHEEDKKRSR